MIPQAVTVVLHMLGGYLIADASDRLCIEKAGTPIAALVGVAKEATDLNFNVPDALGWVVGAELYKLGKRKVWKWEPLPDTILWYQEQPKQVTNNCN